MFSGIHEMAPTDAELATQALAEEGSYRFPAFTAADAVTLVRRSRFLPDGDILKHTYIRAFLFENASGDHNDMEKAKGWLYQFRLLLDTPCFRVQSAIWGTSVG